MKKKRQSVCQIYFSSTDEDARFLFLELAKVYGWTVENTVFNQSYRFIILSDKLIIDGCTNNLPDYGPHLDLKDAVSIIKSGDLSEVLRPTVEDIGKKVFIVNTNEKLPQMKLVGIEKDPVDSEVCILYDEEMNEASVEDIDNVRVVT